jgi:hypothetical protein
MAIEKNCFKVTRVDSEFSSGDIMSSDEEEFPIIAESEEDDEFNDCDSGAGSDDFDLLELGESGEEFCQIWDQTCSIPFEMYDLHGLRNLLSVDIWNDCLTDEERFSLTKFLPEMDQETFMRTLKQLFTGCNFHFGSPISKLFDMLKVGLCEPRVALYRQGLHFFQKRHHYHVLRKYQNSMVTNLYHIRDAWTNCKSYSIEEKLRVLNIVKSQKILMHEKKEELESGSSAKEESTDQKIGQTLSGYQTSQVSSEPAKFAKHNLKGTLKKKEFAGRFSSSLGFESQSTADTNERTYEIDVQKDQSHKLGRNYEAFRGKDYPTSRNDLHGFSSNNGNRMNVVNQLSDIKVLTAKPINNNRMFRDHGKKLMFRNLNLTQYEVDEPFWHSKVQGEPFSANPSLNFGDWDASRSKNWKSGSLFADTRLSDEFKLLKNGVRSGPVFDECEETESNSSEPPDDDEIGNPLMRSKWAYPCGVTDMKTGPCQKIKIDQREKKHKGRIHDVEENYGSAPGWFNSDEQHEIYKMGRKQSGEFGRNYFVPHMPYLPDYLDDNGVTEAQLRGCNSSSKNRRFKEEVAEREDNDYLQSTLQQQFEGVVTSKKRGKRKVEEDEPSELLQALEPAIEEIEVETKLVRKPFVLIIPTVHTGFSFSVVHLLTAVRTAMITMLPEDSLTNVDTERSNPNNPCVSSLTVVEIVNRVRSNPGDPCILETQEPLQDLVRGVLKIFSSKTAPLGAKGWKALVQYERSTKNWSWVGPVSQNPVADEPNEEATSPESWGLPHKMLVKLVDSFANWLKSGQETLQQIGSLPAPPLTLMQVNLDEKERFRDLRAQKSLSTIQTSSQEVKDYFRKEEILRYSIPDRAFSYTAVDGKKSIVAPLRRCGGKPTAKARDHWMLKRERPPHVTILCLVRDAAARLPGSIGTRADVCTLIRDSQFVVEDVTDQQVNQVVSGALDRLHYERDPCVQFDGERKLWVYLHRDREEEDFEDDGTSSTKKWKRQKKEPAELADQPTAVTAADVEVATEEELAKVAEVQENGDKLLCQENSTNEDFEEDDEGSDGDPLP